MTEYARRVVILALSYILLLIVIIFLPDVLPQKYFFDSNTILIYIEDIRRYGYEVRFFDSYYNTAVFYEGLGLAGVTNPPSLFLRVIFFTMSWLPFAYLYTKAQHSETLLFLCVSGVLSIYCSQYTKEIIAIWALFLSILCVQKAQGRSYLFIVFLFIYCIFYREYWILVIYYSTTILLFQKMLINKKVLVVLSVAAGLMPFMLVEIINGDFITDFRFRVNEGRFGMDVGTMINNLIVNTNFMTDALNACISLLRLVLPIELALTLSIKYIIFLGYWLLVLFTFTKVIVKQGVNIYTSLFISYLFTFAMFEPDFGSFLKHSPIFVLLLLASEVKYENSARH